MTPDLLLKNGRCITWDKETNQMIDLVADIAILDGKIFDFGPNLNYESPNTRDLKGLLVLPGCIDSQVHFREPGLIHKEDLESGTRSALMGGITSIFEMPNTNPATTNKEAFKDKLSRISGRAWTHYAFYIGATPENIDELSELEQLPHCAGIKIFMGSSTGTLLIDKESNLEQILKSGKKRVIVHSEDEERLVSRKQIAIDADHPRAHNIWRDPQTAILATERLLRLARKTGRKIHVLHITTADEMIMLAANKDIASVEVLPQHLSLFAPDCYENLGTYAQMNPPIREKNHQDGLWSAVNNGTVDVLGSDHAPHSIEEKNKPYPSSPSGMPGVQTILPLILTHFIDGKLPLSKAVELLTEGPRRVFNIKNKGRLAKGFDADISIIDLNKKWTFTEQDIVSRCGWSPFTGYEFKAKVESVYLNGKLAMQNDYLFGIPQGKAINFEN